MLDPLDFENRPYLESLSRKRRFAFLSLSIERLTLALWRVFFFILFFFGLWLLSIPSFFGYIGEVTASLSFIIGLIYLAHNDFRHFYWPSRTDIDSAIERSTNISRGTIRLLDDTLANPKTEGTRTLWQNALKRVVITLKSLRTPIPKAVLTRSDPYGLRFVAILMFLSGYFANGYFAFDKIHHGLFPYHVNEVVSQGQETQIWITPPDYTQMAQIHIKGHGTTSEMIDIPEGSTAKVRTYSIFGEWLKPHFYNGQDYLEMTPVGEGLYDFETDIQNGAILSVSQGYIPRLRLSYNHIVDHPPEITHDMTKEDIEEQAENNSGPEEVSIEKIEILDSSEIRIPITVKDDYGVKDLQMIVSLDQMIEEKPLGSDFTDTRLVSSPPRVDFKLAPIFDLTWHTWSGLPVTVELIATDHKGQTARLGPMELIMPERVFKHPMAKSLIALRKKLAWGYRDDFVSISRDLETLLTAPDYFQNNPVAYLAVRSAASRLYYHNKHPQEDRTKQAKEAIKLLWFAAIAIEDGDLALAMQELRDTQRALEHALRDPNSTPEEIARLMEELRQKMANYFAELQREMQKRMAEGETFQPLDPQDFTQMITPDALSQMLQELEQALQDGDTQRAGELMSQMQRMMDLMDPSRTQQLPQDMQAMQHGVNELQELIERQEKLLEQTQEQARVKRLLDGQENFAPRSTPSLEEMLKEFGIETIPPAPEQEEQPDIGEAPKVDTLANKTEQEALRYILGQLMLDTAEKIGEIPEEMGLAEQEMRGSERALEQNEPTKSVPHQELALEYLKDSQQQLQQQLQQRMQQMIGMSLSGGSQNYDPLGRPFGGQEEENGQAHGSRVKVPDEGQRKRVDEILKKLRDRSGDRSRSDDELDYFRRLLRQF